MSKIIKLKPTPAVKQYIADLEAGKRFKAAYMKWHNAEVEGAVKERDEEWRDKIKNMIMPKPVKDFDKDDGSYRLGFNQAIWTLLEEK